MSEIDFPTAAKLQAEELVALFNDLNTFWQSRKIGPAEAIILMADYSAMLMRFNTEILAHARYGAAPGTTQQAADA